MSHIENYIIGAKIYESDNSLVFRARERQGERPVILKFLRQDYPDPDELARYRQEYEITRSLLSLSDVIEVYDQFANSKSLAMVVEDFGGSSLSLLQAKQQFSLHQALSIGIRVAQALAKVHHHRIIHKDINPNNIVYNLTTDTLKLIDFGISTRLPRQSAKLTNAEKTEGTIAYISPEQTGRMNRYIDHRTDFYSLGITLYELVCGQRPFTEQDSLKLLHCHLAKKPTPPHIVDPSVPVMVSRIIMKLLAKNAEERYTSGWGIASDLQACERGLDATGPEVEFSLAINDHSDRLEIPQKLYGREVELRRLMEIYGRVSAGQTQFVLISGYSGIGKTTLIQELHRPVTLSGGYFISGKFDQLQRIPYSALGQAFAELIHQLLTASESELARWRQRLVAALRTDAQVIVELVPDLALIIGPQAPVEELGAIETRLRFERVMAAFLGVFCQPEHPTVIFIDDLQWADSVSLEILEGLIRSKDLQNLLIVGAYRDNEVNPTHPLMLMQSSLQASNIDLPTMALRDLTTIDIRHLLSDTLRLPTDRTAPLASLLKRKTGGNPFFLNQLLLSLYEEGELTSTFTDNHGAQSWHWDIERIESIRSTDNVVDLMVDKLQQLPDRVQVMLQLSSCLGNTFDLKTLAIIGECSMQDAFANLQPAARAGFIIPLSELTTIPNPEHTPDLVHIDYRFLHDRVQQAAYALIPEIRRRSLHTQSGRLLLSSLDSTAREKRLFEIVDHLNKGIELTDPAEILERATLNLHAAKKAKAATAFEAGRHYVNQAMADLPARCWQDDYAMAIEAASLQVELESVAGHHELAEQLAQQTLERAEHPVDKANIYRQIIVQRSSLAQWADSLEMGIIALSELGVDLPDGGFHELLLADKAKIEQHIADKPIASLIEMRECRSSGVALAVLLLSKLGAPVYLSKPDLFPLISTRMLLLAFDHGLKAEIAMACICYGMVLAGQFQEYSLAYEYGRLGLAIADRFNDRSVKSQATTTFLSHLVFWRKPFADNEALVKRGFQAGIEVGDLEFTSYMLQNHSINCFVSGERLGHLRDRINGYTDHFNRGKNPIAHVAMGNIQLAISNLRGETKDANSFAHDDLDEGRLLQDARSHTNNWGICMYYIYKAQVKFYNGDYRDTDNLLLAAKELLPYISTTSPEGDYYYLRALTTAALYPNEQEQKSTTRLDELDECINWLARCAETCEENWGHKHLLARAERARIAARPWDAIEDYDRAIASADRNRCLPVEATANLLAGSFWLDRGKRRIGAAYILDSHQCFVDWGAQRIADKLKAEFPRILSRQRRDEQELPTTDSITTTDSLGHPIDLQTVIEGTHAITNETNLPSLLTKIMEISLRNAGAEQGLLILARSGDMVIKARGVARDSTHVELMSVDLHQYEDSPESIVQYVTRTGEP